MTSGLKNSIYFVDMPNPSPLVEEVVTLPISITQNRESTKWSWLNPGK
jgi:hypothetical protein